ncbi:MAG: hypothetical protein LBU70_09320 [Chitinispirillales bacterium]|nr:hypothetical protein [Chitinispirillales bacterium]
MSFKAKHLFVCAINTVFLCCCPKSTAFNEFNASVRFQVTLGNGNTEQ